MAEQAEEEAGDDAWERLGAPTAPDGSQRDGGSGATTSVIASVEEEAAGRLYRVGVEEL